MDNIAVGLLFVALLIGVIVVILTVRKVMKRADEVHRRINSIMMDMDAIDSELYELNKYIMNLSDILGELEEIVEDVKDTEDAKTDE